MGIRSISLAAATLVLSTNVYGAVISSTFDTDSEGWTVVGDATSGVPAYVASGGNAGGYIKADDTVSGGVWYFQAPDKYLGDMTGAYNQTLNYDLMQTGSGSQFQANDVVLTGGGQTLVLGLSANPLPLGDWVSYSVSLSETAGWLNGGVAATQGDMLNVLGSLTTLKIRGEYISGPDTGRLDNVSLNTVPVPAAAWLFGSGLISLIGIARRKKA